MATATVEKTTIATMLDFRLPPEQFDVVAEWKSYVKVLGGVRRITRQHRDTFHLLANFLTEQERVVVWCHDCDMAPASECVSRTYPTVCAKCIKTYKTCGMEGCIRKSNGLYETRDANNDPVEVCNYCIDAGSFVYCAKCNSYYHRENAVAMSLHLHICDCLRVEADGFTIRNDGQPALANDTRATVQMAGGIISASDIRAISNYLYAEGLFDAYYKSQEIGTDWQTREGNWPKRLAKALYKDGSSNKLNKDQMSNVGTLAAQHTSAVDPVHLEVTRNFARSAREFHHAGSCWWSGYEYSKCTLKTIGGFGIRTFVSADSDRTAGRAWVIPLKKTDNNNMLVPTHDVEGHDAFIVFNGYGNLERYAAPRLLAHMAGWTYKQDTTFGCNNMSVNGQSGYIVGPTDLLTTHTVGYLHISNKHRNPWA